MGAVSAAGNTPEALLNALYDHRDCFRVPRHFDSRGRRLGVIAALDGRSDASRGVALLELLRESWPWPEGLRACPMPLYLATTVGLIDELERAAAPEAVPDTSMRMLAEARRIFGASRGLLAAEACASGSRAVEWAAQAVIEGAEAAALAIGSDIAGEFVTAGFDALGALSPTVARPYSATRDGLTLGEAAAGVVLMRDELAERLGLPELGRVMGWGASCDAAHITAPDASGIHLAEAIRRALEAGRCPASGLAGIVGHGTGTVYNDAAELAGLSRALGETDGGPLFSLKGTVGHTLGATGVLQLITGLLAVKQGRWPGANYLAAADTVMPEAAGRLGRAARPVTGRRFLSIAIGFGGLNNVLLAEGRRP